MHVLVVISAYWPVDFLTLLSFVVYIIIIYVYKSLLVIYIQHGI